MICSVMFSQAGKHEAIVKNVHDLLAKLAWDFSPEQLDHLFDCFKVTQDVCSAVLLRDGPLDSGVSAGELDER